MIHKGSSRSIAQAFTALALVLCTSITASAAPVFWTDWLGADTDPGPGFTAQGTITTSTSTVGVTYTNPQGIGFYQNGVSVNKIGGHRAFPFRIRPTRVR